MLKICWINDWDEIGCETNAVLTDDGEDDHDIPYSLTDNEIVEKLRTLNKRDREPDEDDNWDFVAMARTPSTAIVEWTNGRHVAITTIIWIE